jgi:hypothetical protein
MRFAFVRAGVDSAGGRMRLSGVTIGGISTQGWAVLKASHRTLLRNMTEQLLQAKNPVS